MIADEKETLFLLILKGVNDTENLFPVMQKVLSKYVEMFGDELGEMNVNAIECRDAYKTGLDEVSAGKKVCGWDYRKEVSDEGG